jgi:hypothetical protein
LQKMSNEIAAKLGVADEKEVDPKPRMEDYKEHYRQFLGMVVPMLAGSQGGSTIIEVNLDVAQNFDLQTLFDKWFARKKSDGAFLFQDNDYTQKLLGRWNVQYEGIRSTLSLLMLVILSWYLHLTLLVGFAFSFKGGQDESSSEKRNDGDRPGGTIPRVYLSAMESDVQTQGIAQNKWYISCAFHRGKRWACSSEKRDGGHCYRENGQGS